MKKKEQLIYRCALCNKTAEFTESKDAPICCDEKMIPEPLPQCTSTTHPEMVRNTDDDEPCDDGTGKQS
mgnify:CR=1 FL=1